MQISFSGQSEKALKINFCVLKILHVCGFTLCVCVSACVRV